MRLPLSWKWVGGQRFTTFYIARVGPRRGAAAGNEPAIISGSPETCGGYGVDSLMRTDQSCSRDKIRYVTYNLRKKQPLESRGTCPCAKSYRGAVQTVRPACGCRGDESIKPDQVTRYQYALLIHSRGSSGNHEIGAKRFERDDQQLNASRPTPVTFVAPIFWAYVTRSLHTHVSSTFSQCAMGEERGGVSSFRCPGLPELPTVETFCARVGLLREISRYVRHREAQAQHISLCGYDHMRKGDSEKMFSVPRYCCDCLLPKERDCANQF
jgi:hypothetical protein